MWEQLVVILRALGEQTRSYLDAKKLCAPVQGAKPYTKFRYENIEKCKLGYIKN